MPAFNDKTTKRTSVFCGECKTCILRRPSKTGMYFCSIKCKALWQQSQKPVTKEWLIDRYITDGMDCTQIAQLVNRNSKSVWNWLNGLGIATRCRGYGTSTTRFKPGQISAFKGKRHTLETRAVLSAIAIADGRVPFDPNVGPPLKGKRGADVPTWKGGVTPDRQSAYSTSEWKDAVKAVWRRDNATCQRCSARQADDRDRQFDIHHIVSFACSELRSEVSNLVLLCERCHYWVHSSGNVSHLFTKEIPANEFA